MADPTIQTFCCHHDNSTDMSFRVMQEFNTDAYNAVCLTSSALGIFGAIYQILPREQGPVTHRWLSFSATRGRKIIIWLAVADLLASLGIFARSTLWIRYKNIMPAMNDHSSTLFCAVSSAWTQYFYTATWIWTLCYAIDMRLILADKKERIKWYHFVSWVIPAILTTIGLTILYLPDANCHTAPSLSTALMRILPNYIVTYVPILIVMIANPVLYRSSTKDMEFLITSSLGQLTSREREIMDTIKMKFSLINFVFYICWIPNLINGILLWSLWFQLPIKVIIVVWYIMALINPLQALLNSLVYRRWTKGTEKIAFPFLCAQKNKTSLNSSFVASTPTSSLLREENMPLLRSIPRASINRYL